MNKFYDTPRNRRKYQEKLHNHKAVATRKPLITQKQFLEIKKIIKKGRSDG